MIDGTLVDSIAALERRSCRAPGIKVGHLDYLYNDAKNCYEVVDRYVKQGGSVANVPCLAQVVLEEARRRENADGSWMTVTFTEAGATFSPDDKSRLDEYVYERRLSPEWKVIREHAGKMMKHVEFLRLLQRLRSVLTSPATIIGAFRSLDVQRVARIASSPTLQDGKASVSLAVEVTAKITGGGETPVTKALPGELIFVLPFARGGRTLHELIAEVTAEVAREGEKETLLFGYVIPDLTERERDARAREVAEFRADVESLPRLLILENF